jgi:hypothetical protein
LTRRGIPCEAARCGEVLIREMPTFTAKWIVNVYFVAGEAVHFPVSRLFICYVKRQPGKGVHILRCKTSVHHKRGETEKAWRYKRQHPRDSIIMLCKHWMPFRVFSECIFVFC